MSENRNDVVVFLEEGHLVPSWIFVLYRKNPSIVLWYWLHYPVLNGIKTRQENVQRGFSFPETKKKERKEEKERKKEKKEKKRGFMGMHFNSCDTRSPDTPTISVISSFFIDSSASQLFTLDTRLHWRERQNIAHLPSRGKHCRKSAFSRRHVDFIFCRICLQIRAVRNQSATGFHRLEVIWCRAPFHLSGRRRGADVAEDAAEEVFGWWVASFFTVAVYGRGHSASYLD